MNRRRLFAVSSAVTIVVISALAVGIIYTQPWSTIRLTVQNDSSNAMNICVYVDGVVMNHTSGFYSGVVLSNGGQVVGSYHVKPGTHIVGIDEAWDMTKSTKRFDYIPDSNRTCRVGPLLTENLVIHIQQEDFPV